MIKVTCNGKTIEVKRGTNYYDISSFFDVLNPLAVKTYDDILSLKEVPSEDIKIEYIDVKHFYGRAIYKGGVKLIFQVSLKRLFPNMNVSFKHSVPGGMLLEVCGDKILETNDVLLLKKEMQKISDQDEIIKKITIRKKEAIKFYKTNNELEKSTNVSRITDKAITLYHLEGINNFFYSEMPYKTGVIKNFEVVYLGQNRIIILFPNGKTNGNTPTYEHNQEIINTYLNSKSWLESMNLTYVSNLNDLVGSGEVKNIIKSSELKFGLNIYNVADEIIKDKEIKYIMIAGPSSSGKTTTTKRLGEYLFSKGYDPVVISSDDYFIDRDKLKKNENGEYDLECLAAVDVKYLNNDLHKLTRGELVTLPSYNFINGEKELRNRPIKLKDNSIILIEGIHSLNDDLIPNIGKSEKYKIYLSPFIPLNIDRHNYISSLDLRLLRRMVRDNRSRGYEVSETIHNWRKVRDGEEKNIFPYIKGADAIINTALVYELGVLKTYAEPLLLNVEVDSMYYMEAKRLLNFLKPFFAITSEYIDSSSILREFIGGGDD